MKRRVPAEPPKMDGRSPRLGPPRRPCKPGSGGGDEDADDDDDDADDELRPLQEKHENQPRATKG